MDMRDLEGRTLVEALVRALVAGPVPKDELAGVLPALGRIGPQDVVEAVDAVVAEALVSEGGLEGLKPGVSRLLHLCRTALAGGPPLKASPLFDYLAAENRLGLGALEKVRGPLGVLTASQAQGAEAGPDGGLHSASVARALDELSTALEDLAPFMAHYERLENVVFPWFEAHFSRFRCLTLMWSLHDDVRASFKELRALALRIGADPGDLGRASGRLFFDLHALVFREERILFPVLGGLLDPQANLDLYRQARDLGPGLVGREDAALLEARALGWGSALEALAEAGTQATPVSGDPAPRAPAADAALPLDAGALSPLALDSLLKALHLDLTFIDPDNKVAYFSNGPHRVFPRSPAVIGRDVRNCHPHQSLARVLGLIEDLRSGKRDREAFWISKGGRFVHIEYAAVRGPDGRFLGVLEASEDLTDKRSLSGEKRLASEA